MREESQIQYKLFLKLKNYPRNSTKVLGNKLHPKKEERASNRWYGPHRDWVLTSSTLSWIALSDTTKKTVFV